MRSVAPTPTGFYRALGPAGDGASAPTRLTTNPTRITGTSYIDTSTTSGQTYRYQVAAVNAGGEGAHSTIQSLTLRPGQVTGFTLVAGDGQVTLSWSAVNGATSYRIYRRDQNSGGNTLRLTTDPARITGTSYIDSGLTNTQTYGYRVVAVNAGGIGQRSSAYAITLPPGKVTELTLTAGLERVTLSWSAVSGATAYWIYRALGPAGDDAPALTRLITDPATITTTSYTDYSPTNGQTYRYQVVAVAIGAGGEGERSDIRSITLSPGQVTGLTLTSSDGQVTLSWNAVDGATSYRIYRQVDSGSINQLTPTNPPTIITTRYTDTSTTSGRTYGYVITAVNAGGAGNIGGTTRSITLSPGQVTGLTLTGGDGQVTLSWSAVNGADSYRIYRALGPAGDGASAPTRLTPTNPATITTTGYIDRDPSNNQTYRYQVTAFNDGGEGDHSAVRSITLPPDQVTGLTLTRGDGQVTLSWSAVDGADSYRIYRALGPAGDSAPAPTRLTSTNPATITTTGYIDRDPSSGKTYRYQVVAVNDGGEGDHSAVRSVTLRPGQVTGLTLTGGNGQVTLSWSAVDGADSYRIYRALGPAGDGASAPTRLTPTNPATITTTGYIDRDPSNNQTYRYQVTAFNDGGEGDHSAVRFGHIVPRSGDGTYAYRRQRTGNAELECGRRCRLLPDLPRPRACRGRCLCPNAANHHPDYHYRHQLHRPRPDQRPDLPLPGGRGQRRRRRATQ